MLPEDEYLLLLAASEDDEGDLKPEFLEELRRRGQRTGPTAPHPESLMDGLASPQQSGNQQQLRRREAPSLDAQRRVPNRFNKTSLPL